MKVPTLVDGLGVFLEVEIEAAGILVRSRNATGKSATDQLDQV